MTLVETYPDEAEIEFRLDVDAQLQAVYPDRAWWWHPYEVRGRYECRGIRFREFYCVAGSVQCCMWSIATKFGGRRRVALVPDESMIVFGPITIEGRGERVIIDPREIRSLDPEYPKPWRQSAADRRPSWLKRLFK